MEKSTVGRETWSVRGREEKKKYKDVPGTKSAVGSISGSDGPAA